MSTSSHTPTPPASVQSNKTLSTLMQCMDRIAPLSLADKSFDNVGLLLQSPSPRPGKGVHLCIDLTCSVLEEALEHKEKEEEEQISTILCYHPIIFRGLKSLTMQDSQQGTLLRCAMEGISVFCPHTALDATPGGINDWLAQGCAASSSSASSTYPTGFKKDPTPCKPSQEIPQGFHAAAAAGMGRHFLLSSPIPLSELVRRVKEHLGLQHVQIATPFAQEDPEVQKIAVCAGSGGSVLAGSGSGGGEDCWLTGELSHHEILACIAKGRSVILTNHTNTERGYLSAVLKPRLEELAGDRLVVSVSRVDRDPLRVV